MIRLATQWGRGDPYKPASAQIVYRDHEAVGCVSLRAGRWHAIDLNGRPLGRFETRLAAWAAVLRTGAR